MLIRAQTIVSNCLDSQRHKDKICDKLAGFLVTLSNKDESAAFILC